MSKDKNNIESNPKTNKEGKKGKLYPIKDLKTSSNIDPSNKNYSEIETDNKYLLFNRTKNGLRIDNFDTDFTYVIQNDKPADNSNKYVDYNRTPEGSVASEVKRIFKNVITGNVGKDEDKGFSANDYTDTEKAEVAKIKDKADKVYVDVELDKKVDKILGKGLSTNDYTTLQKAEVAKIKDKADKVYVDVELDKKVDKILGKGLSTNDYTTDERNKLKDIEEGANKYTHPNTHPAGMIEETNDKKFVSNTEKNKWSAKETPEGAQLKAGTALNDAKTYVNNKVKVDVPADAKFTDTTYTSGDNISIVDGKISVIGQLGLTEDEVKKVKVDNAKDADRVGGKTVGIDVPADAKFTDTIVNISGKADKTYVDDKITTITNRVINIDEAHSAALDDLNSRLKTDVPEGAVFTDTTYTSGDNISIVDGKISITGQLGLTEDEVKKVEVDNAKKVNGFTVERDVPADAKFTDTTYVIPTELPASDVSPWAKKPNKPSYNAHEVGALPDTTKIPSIEGLATEKDVDDKLNNKSDKTHNHTLESLSEKSYNSLTDKPLLGEASSKDIGATEGKIPIIGVGGKLNSAIIPQIKISETFVVDTEEAMLDLTVGVGDVVVRPDLGKTFILKEIPASSLGNWQELITPTTNLVQSVSGKIGDVILEKGDVGLGNVDNTSDNDKPVSAAQAIAIEKKADKIEVNNKIKEVEESIDVKIGNYDFSNFVERIDVDNIYNELDGRITNIENSGGGGSGGTGILFRMKTISPSIINTAEGNETSIKYTWSSIDTIDNTNTGVGTLNISVGGLTVISRPIEQGDNSFNASDYLRAGINNITITVSDSYGNSRALTYQVSLISLNISSPYDPTTINTGEIIFRYVPIGSVLKTVHFELNGVEIGTEEVAINNRQLTYKIPKQTHGAHSLKVYMTANIEGFNIKSNTLIYDIICIEDDKTDTIIASTITDITMDVFSTVEIPYVVYTPNLGYSDVTLKEDNISLPIRRVDRTLQKWNYKALREGNMNLSINSGGAIRNIPITVNEAEVSVEAEDRDLSLHLTSVNRSNNSADRDEWSYKDVSATLTGFNYRNNGWVIDKDGSVALKVSNKARVSIPYKPFESNFKDIGKTIEIDFSISDVSNMESEVIRCFNDNVGFKITPQQAYFSSSLNFVDTKFKDGERIRVSFVVTKRSDESLIQVYVNGVFSGVQNYGNIDSFIQNTPQNIEVGSDGCSVSIYNIRVYENNLNQYQLLDNYIADMDNLEKKIEIFNSNNIYDDYGIIDFNKAVSLVPSMIIEGVLPQFKGDKRKVNIYYTNVQDPSKSYTAIDAQIDVQGTSSQYYPRKNWKIKHDNGFETSEGFSTKYKLRDNSIPEKTFTMKADFAESSGVHNTGLAVYYEWAWRQLGFRVPTQNEGYTNDVRTTVDGFPCLIFHRETPDSILEFTGKYNFNNDKTDATFGFEEGMVSWEMRNNTSPRVLFQSDDFDSLDADGNPDWLNDYEDRYPDNGYSNPTRLRRLTEWVVSCTNNSEKFKAEVSDYFDVNSLLFYYIMTEFTAGVDQRAKNMFLTWYGKDENDTTDKCYLIFYDNDTAFGINNEGANVFGYGVEYHDKIGDGVGTSNVWNASDSVLWNLVENTLSDEIQSLYSKMRAEGVISYEVFKRFLDDNHSALWSESIYNEDGQFKYIDPLIIDGNGSYLYALQGSREMHRQYWIYNRVLYMDSKYSVASHLTDYVTMRLYTPSNWAGVAPNYDFELTGLGDGYARVKYGSYIVKKRIKGNQVETIKAPEGMVFSDTETIVYGAKALKSIGDLSGKYVGTLDMSKATNIVDLTVGSTNTGYKNRNLIALTLGSNKLLKSLNIANCVNLKQTINLTGCESIEYIEAKGSGITGVELPDSGYLEYLSLPAVSSLILKSQVNLTNENIILESYSELKTAVIESCPFINPFELLQIAPSLSNIRLVGFKGESATAESLTPLLNVGGVDSNGNLTEQSYVEGTWNVERLVIDEYRYLKNVWSDLTLTYDFLILIFEDLEVERVLVEHYDIDNYGDISVNEINTITTLGDIFKNNTTIVTFDEFKWFEGMTTINKGAFSGATSLSKITLPENVEVIEASAFKDVGFKHFDLTSYKSLSNIDLLDSTMETVELYSEDVITSLKLPSTLTSLKLLNRTITQENFEIGGLNNLRTLWVENTPNIKAIDLAKGVLINRVRLMGINIVNENQTLFNLANASGIDSDGDDCDISMAVTGSSRADEISQDLLDFLEETYPLVSFTYGRMLEPFKFQDAEVERVLVNEFQINGRGFLVEEQLAEITSLGVIFKDNKLITTFNELELFTGITEIGVDAFSGCSNLSNLKLPNGIIKIDSNSFKDTDALTNLDLSTYSELSSIDLLTARVKNITLPINSKLTMLKLPAVNTLTLKNQTLLAFTELTLDSYENITTLVVDNCPLINPISIYRKSINVENVRLTGISGDGDVSDFNELAKLKGVDVNGNIIANSYLEGSVYFEELFINSYELFTSIWNELDITYGQLIEPVEFVDPEVERVLLSYYDVEKKGYLTIDEVEQITNFHPDGSGHGSIFRENRVITRFPELGLFTGLTTMDNIFYNCSSLVEVGEIPHLVTNMNSAFNGCRSLINAPEIIPKLVTRMDYTFSECSSLVNAPDVIPDLVATMYSAFYYCSSLVNAPSVIGKSVTNMIYAFSGCSSLVNGPVEIPDSVTNMTFAFYNCSKLVNAPVLGKSVSSLVYTFGECTSLVKAPTIPRSVFEFNSAFHSCRNLDGIIEMEGEIPPLYVSSFTYVQLKVIYVPDVAVETYKSASGWIEHESIIKGISEKPID